MITVFFFLSSVGNTKTTMEILLDGGLQWRTPCWPSLPPSRQLAQPGGTGRGWRNFSDVALLIRIYCSLHVRCQEFWFRNEGRDVLKQNNCDCRQCSLIQSSCSGQWISCALGRSLFPSIWFWLQDAYHKTARQESQKYALCCSLFILLRSHLFTKKVSLSF